MQKAKTEYEVRLVGATIEGDWAVECTGRRYASRAEAVAAIDQDPTTRPDAHGNTCTLDIVAVKA